MTVYDRSWYGRLLVERVEEEISSDVASRSAKEIVDFESALVADGTTIIKFWMHISDDEQLRRFQERESNPLKQWKLTPEDWRNRDKRAAYENAADAMFSSTDHHGAHWNLIPAENKHFARVAVLETLIARWEHDLEKRGFAVPPSQGNDYLA
jgi:polyphosphate kinase 2 (PPK2 family)